MAATTLSVDGHEVTLVQVKEGDLVQPPRSKTRQRVGQTFEVFLGEVSLGFVAREMLTRERRSERNRYVSDRWESPGWVVRQDRAGHRVECFTRSEGVRKLLRRPRR